MAKATIVTRKRGRPRAEESVAIKMDKSMLDLKSVLAELVPEAIKTLKSLLVAESEKVRETTARFIIEKAEEAQAAYITEENEKDVEGGPATPAASKDKSMDLSRMPLTTKIREYKMAEGED